MADSEQPPGKGYRPLASSLVRLVILGGGVVALICCTLVGVHMRDVLERTEEDALTREVATLQLSLQAWLTDRQQSLRESSRLLSLMAQNRDRQGSPVRVALLDEITILGESYPLFWFDNQLQLLATTSMPGASPPHTTLDWVPDLLSGAVSSHINIIRVDGREHWQLAVPVAEAGQVQGLLVARIPLLAMLRQLHLKEQLKGIHLDLERNGRALFSLGDMVDEGVVVLHRWEDAGLTLRYSIDLTQVLESRDKVVFELLLVMLLAMVIGGVASYMLAMRWLVLPVRQLQQAASALAVGDRWPIQALRASIRSRELHQLATEFRRMSANVLKRERELESQNQQLQVLAENVKSKQAQLIQTERMASIGTLSAGVAHEINNPLGCVKSNLCTLREYTETLMNLAIFCQAHRADPELSVLLQARLVEAERTQDLEFLVEDLAPLLADSIEGAERIEVIVQGLKTFADEGLATVDLVDVNLCIDTILGVLKSDLDFHTDVVLERQMLPQIRAVRSQINQVILNVVRNAVQAIEREGQIYISTWQERGEVVIQVRDTGEGIAQQDISKLFTPFYTTRPVGKGSGLGLSISHNIIEQHGGRIEVSSVLGEGAEFNIILPAVCTQSASRSSITAQADK